jgi:tRNA A-37 threonylcarbamoyl transferase component Bud32/outer membrane biosynthesis protein TonB
MSDASPATPTRAGKTVGGKYRLVRLLGSGGMGEVYEAQHAGIGRRFAIKFLHPLLAGNHEAVARFQREAQAAGGLENENIAAVVDMGNADDGTPFLVMEFLDGEDLGHLLVRSGPLSAPRATYITIQACRGLAAAHVRNIVHRDLKPENLYICKRNDGSDQVKVLDFGIAKLHANTGLTQTGTTMGTPFYMSPEQARGAKEVDVRTDIYSLGVILYEMLSGAKPHPGDSYNEILYHVLTQEPAALDTVRPGLPPGLAAVVHKAMAHETTERFASAAEFTAALIPFAGRAVTPVRSQVGLAAAGDTLSSPVSLPVMGVVTPPWPEPLEATAPVRKGPRLRVWAVLAAGAAAVVGAWLAWPTTQAKPQPPTVAPRPAAIPAPTPAPPPLPASPPPTPSQPAPSAPAAKAVEPPPERPAAPVHPKHAGRPRASGRATQPAPTVPTDGAAEAAPHRKLIRAIDRDNPFGQ